MTTMNEGQFVTAKPVTVRLATTDDFLDVQALFGEGDRYHQSLGIFGIRIDSADYPLASFEAALESESTAIMVAASDAQILGFIRLEQITLPVGRFHSSRTLAIVHEIVVAECVRGHGVGKTLMQAARTWTVERGISSLELNVFGKNEDAREFYRSLGFDEGVRLRLDLSAAT